MGREEALAEKVGEYNQFDQSSQELSFFQRNFYRPSDHDREGAIQHRFSLLSRGALICAGGFCIIMLAVLATLLGVFLDRHHKQVEYMRRMPVRQALVANFPDPTILQHNGTWYAFATNNAAGILEQPTNSSSYEYGTSNVQVATSTDFVNWTLLSSSYDPLPRTGEWVQQGLTERPPPIPRANVWAPAVLQRPSDGKFIMYYSASASNATRSHCLGGAISNTSSPLGPYEPLPTPLACPIPAGGAIDPATFVDTDDSIYVLWKVDGNNVGHGGSCGNMVDPQVPTPIRLQRMRSDGVTPDGEPITILDRTKDDGPLVEAPELVKSKEGVYFLFFSSGCTRAPTYDLKYAWSYNISGPYTRAALPLLSTGDWGLLAPGSVGVARAEEDVNGTEVWRMAFHARVTTNFGRVRSMWTAGLTFNGTAAFLQKVYTEEATG